MTGEMLSTSIEGDGVRYAAHRGAVLFMNGPYVMQEIAEAATFEDAVKLATALNSYLPRATPQDGPCLHIARDMDGSTWVFTSPATLDTRIGQFYCDDGLGSLVGDEIGDLLGLAPGEVKRFRLVPEAET